METLLLIIICVLLLISIVFIIVFRNKNSNEPHLEGKIAELQSSFSKIELNLKEDSRINREENATIGKDTRIELNNSLRNIADQSQNSLKEINKTLEDKLGTLVSQIESNNKINREELTKNITDFSGANVLQVDKINNQAKEDNRLIREALLTAFKGFQETFDKKYYII